MDFGEGECWSFGLEMLHWQTMQTSQDLKHFWFQAFWMRDAQPVQETGGSEVLSLPS